MNGLKGFPIVLYTFGSFLVEGPALTKKAADFLTVTRSKPQDRKKRMVVSGVPGGNFAVASRRSR